MHCDRLTYFTRCYLLFLSIIFIVSCQNEETKKVSTDYVLDKIEKGEITIFSLPMPKDSVGNVLTDVLKAKRNSGKMYRDFYFDSKGNLEEIRLREIKNTKDKLKEIQIKAALCNPLREIKIVDFDCNEVNSIIEKCYNNDQSVRHLGNTESLLKTDEINRHIIISILEKCDIQDIFKSNYNKLFLIVQHMDVEIVARYLPVFLEMYSNGSLSNFNYARLIDRILMNSGYPQIYGTQSVGHSFYEIIDVQNVNLRRGKLGLIPIEDAAFKIGFEFKMEDYLED
jgi:hypothetical protein